MLVKTYNYKKMLVITTLAGSMCAGGCVSPDSNSNGQVASNSTGQSSTSPAVATASLVVYGPTIGGSIGVQIFPSSGISSIKMITGNTYTFTLSGTNIPSGATFNLTGTNTSIPGLPAMTPKTLSLGKNTFIAPSAGNYSMNLAMDNTSTSGVTFNSKTYTSSVSCAAGALSLINSGSNIGLNVTQATADAPNAFGFTITGVSSSVTGTPFTSGSNSYYFCAIDPTGVNIIDTAYQNCDAAFSNVFVNYLGTRSIAIVIRDACNFSQTVHRTVTLNPPSPMPTPTGKIYMYAELGNANPRPNPTGDPRIDGVKFFGGNLPDPATKNLIPSYGSGTFTIDSIKNYGMSSSSNVEMKVIVSGLIDNFQSISPAKTGSTPTVAPSPSTSPSIDDSNARVSTVLYVTDTYTDQSTSLSPTVTLTSANCRTTYVHAKVLSFSPGSCAADTTAVTNTGDNNTAMIEVWGEYVCTGSGALSGSGNGGISVELTSGSFDGVAHMNDTCVAAGGAAPPNPPQQY